MSDDDLRRRLEALQHKVELLSRAVHEEAERANRKLAEAQALREQAAGIDAAKQSRYYDRLTEHAALLTTQAKSVLGVTTRMALICEHEPTPSAIGAPKGYQA